MAMSLAELQKLARYGGGQGSWRARVPVDRNVDPTSDGDVLAKAAWAIRRAVQVGEDFMAAAAHTAGDRSFSREGRVEPGDSGIVFSDGTRHTVDDDDDVIEGGAVQAAE
jgi:hypothetical protein